MNPQTLTSLSFLEMADIQTSDIAYGQFSETAYIPVSETVVGQALEKVEIRISTMAEEVLNLGRKRHEHYRVIKDFRGPIRGQIYSQDGKWRYLPPSEGDKKIIPNAAYKRHRAAVENTSCRVAQVLIGHEIPQFPIEPAKPIPEVVIPELPVVPSTPEFDWGKVAEVAGKGLLIGMMGIAMIPLTAFAALTGGLLLVDPSYCIVLNDGQGTVIELIRWNTEV